MQAVPGALPDTEYALAVIESFFIWGICVPSTCSASEVQASVTKVLEQIHFGNATVSVSIG